MHAKCNQVLTVLSTLANTVDGSSTLVFRCMLVARKCDNVLEETLRADNNHLVVLIWKTLGQGPMDTFRKLKEGVCGTRFRVFYTTSIFTVTYTVQILGLWLYQNLIFLKFFNRL